MEARLRSPSPAWLRFQGEAGDSCAVVQGTSGSGGGDSHPRGSSHPSAPTGVSAMTAMGLCWEMSAGRRARAAGRKMRTWGARWESWGAGCTQGMRGARRHRQDDAGGLWRVQSPRPGAGLPAGDPAPCMQRVGWKTHSCQGFSLETHLKWEKKKKIGRTSKSPAALGHGLRAAMGRS